MRCAIRASWDGWKRWRNFGGDCYVGRRRTVSMVRISHEHPTPRPACARGDCQPVIDLVRSVSTGGYREVTAGGGSFTFVGSEGIGTTTRPIPFRVSDSVSRSKPVQTGSKSLWWALHCGSGPHFFLARAGMRQLAPSLLRSPFSDRCDMSGQSPTLSARPRIGPVHSLHLRLTQRS